MREIEHHILFSQEQIEQEIARLAKEILVHYGEKEEVRVLVLLNGGLWFAATLLQKLPLNYQLESILVSSYGDGMESQELQWKSPMPKVKDTRILLLDDVIDTGKTLKNVHEALIEAGAKEVQSAVLVDKESCRIVNYQANYVGLKAGNQFLLGYGLDLAGKYRNLPYITEVKK